MTAYLALGYLGGINVLTWCLFYVDKKRSMQGHWRIPEKTLISAAVLGGWPAAKHAQRRLRHKTRKQPFAKVLDAVPLMWIAILGLVATASMTTS